MSPHDVGDTPGGDAPGGDAPGGDAHGRDATPRLKGQAAAKHPPGRAARLVAFVKALAAQGRRAPPFWQRKTLAEMTSREWESLCDGCGRCCVVKLEDADTGRVHPTSVACRMLDLETCRCRHYRQRHALVPECLPLDAESLPRYGWLPPTCAYRRVSEGRGLAWWHPLVSGDPETVVQAGVSVRGNVVSESAVHPDEPLDRYVVRWVDIADHPGGR